MTRRLTRKKRAPEPEPEEEEELSEELADWKPTPLLYNVADACFMLGKISKGLLYRLIQTKEIFPIKIGRRSVFTLEELERFVDQKKESAG